MSAILFRGEPLSTDDGGMTVAQQLFYRKWQVTVPEAYYQNKESLSVYGMIHYDNKQYTNAAMHERRHLQIPIAGICIYVEEGAPIELVNPIDSVAIYKLLVEHLNNWKGLTGGLVGLSPPIDDLRSMDTLAEMLYPLVRHYSPKTVHNSIFKASIAQVGVAQELEGLAAPISRRTATVPAPHVSQQSKESVDPGYVSIADIVAREAFKKPW